MGRQESPQLIERKGQVDTDAQETNRASKYMRDHSLFRSIVEALARFFSLITSIYKLNFVVSESENCIDDQDSTASIKATVQCIKRIRQS